MDVEFSLNRCELEALQWRKLRVLLDRILSGKGVGWDSVRPLLGSIGSVREFVEGLPTCCKAELLEDRLRHPPFGSYLLGSIGEYTRICQTSGTSTGQPIAWIDTAESWSAMLDCWRWVYRAAGLRGGEDRIFFAFSFGPFLGFWTAFEAAATDYLAIPGGGLSSKGRLEAMRRYRATVLCCTPTYAIRLGEQIGAESGVAAEELAVHSVIVAGEPGGSLPAARERIGALWGARVYDHHGMTEVGPVSFEAQAHAGQLLVIEESYFAEILDPLTGEEVAEGECGELVLTPLDRASCPLLRYRTGDWVRKGYLNGRLCLQGGVLSRLDDMVVVRGVNLYPSALEEVVRGFDGIVEFEVEQRSVNAMEELALQVELETAMAAGDRVGLVKQLEGRLRDVFSLRIPVREVAAGSLPRYEFKAKRWRKIVGP